MKKFTRFVLLIVLSAISTWGFAQTTVDFETVGNTWSWSAFANGAGGADNAAGITYPVANPATTGINTSANCLKFVEAPTASAWGGFFTLDVGTVTITAETKIVKVMVYKSRLSPFTLKLEGLDFGGGTEIPGANTVINQWEEVSFDLTAHIGKKFNKLTFLPDYTARTAEVTIYIDNIIMPTVAPPVVATAPTTVATAPTHPAANVISIYGTDTYTPITGVKYFEDWGQTAKGSTIGDYTIPTTTHKVLKYGKLSFQGIDFTDNVQNVSTMKYLHMDIWTGDAAATPLWVALINGNQNIAVSKTITTAGSWYGLDIPITDFVGSTLSGINQLMFTSAEWREFATNLLAKDIYLDNIYFWTDVDVTVVVSPKTLNIGYQASNTSTLDITTAIGWTVASDQTWLTASSASGTGNGTVTLTATANTALASRIANVTVTGSDATTNTVVVTQNGAPVSDSPTPTAPAANVKAVFSDPYTPVAAEFQNWSGTTMTEESSATPANKVKKVTSNCCFGYGLTVNDISSMTRIHVDIYPTTLESMTIGIVSNGDKKMAKTLTPNTWNQIDIALADFTGANLANVTQIGFWDLNGTFYMDNLYFYNENAPAIVALTLNVNMTGAALVAGDKVYVAGTFPDWAEPGTNAAFEMLDANADGIYSITLQVPTGTKAFKFFKNAGWNGGEWNGGENRSLVVTEEMTANYVWGFLGMVSVRDNKTAGKILLYPNPVKSDLFVNGLPQNATVKIFDMRGKLLINRQNVNEEIDVNNLAKGVYTIQISGKNGIITKKFVKE